MCADVAAATESRGSAGDRSSTSTVRQAAKCSRAHASRTRFPDLTINPLAPLTSSIRVVAPLGSCTAEIFCPRFVAFAIAINEETEEQIRRDRICAVREFNNVELFYIARSGDAKYLVSFITKPRALLFADRGNYRAGIRTHDLCFPGLVLCGWRRQRKRPRADVSHSARI